ncbi:hypothetical protein I350_03696 [Cryptococcus amylolentus CBS 6273]|uniref:Uncharacterized protein n=1 Tax=Cryptococcus amylolentus CBS 6273 TaxID=1296118 RepID=A0A1E3K7A9_9TREE|nr:hypothetical protein I350_03696 [Cryptococcus amylolentus CBS 6273]
MLAMLTRRVPSSIPRPLHRPLTTLGLRREDPARIWERRAPLTPHTVQRLLTDGKDQLTIHVESCRRRCFTDEQYAHAGASVVSSLSNNVDVVLGIKEPPLSSVQSLLDASKAEGKERTWMMFSHTHKGQEYNVPLLSAFLHPTQTLIDHELLTSEQPGKDGKTQLKRVAAFGWYAGAVGAGEALSLTGLALLKRGIATPLLHLARPYTYGTLSTFKDALRKTGEQFRSNEPAAGLAPIVIGLTGAGNVSSGARQILEELGVEWVNAEDLPGIKSKGRSVYACQVTPESYLEHRGGKSFNKSHYYSSPEDYTSTFARKIAPHLTTIINGVSWSKQYPRAISSSDLATLLRKAKGQQKLVAVQDISCDQKGGLEFVDQFTTIDNPHYEGPGGILISSIDILPTELATDASDHFSAALYPYICQLLLPSPSATAEQETLDRATIVRSGTIQPKHQWLADKVDAWKASGSPSFFDERSEATIARRGGVQKKVLLLGSGLVAGPAVEVFAARSDVLLAVASNNIAEAESHIKGRTNVQAISLDITDDAKLSEAVAAADVVVSLLPAPLHPHVAKHCISHSRHLVTASYISPDIKALHSAAVDADVLLLNECGLDPGIDSMAAMRIMERVKREGKKVKSFVSWCGGLPERSASKGPLGYKFSWSPKAVLTAAQNDAMFKLDGKNVTIPGDRLLERHFSDVRLWDGLQLEGLANRDSIPYAEKYGLGPAEGLTDLFRGTLRYPGFSTLLNDFRRLGLLSSDVLSSPPASWSELLRQSAGRQLGVNGLKDQDQHSAITDLVGKEEGEKTMKALEWLGLLGDSSLPIPKLSTPIDLFAHLLSHKLAYQPGERDTCLLHHSFTLHPFTPGGREEVVTASLRHIGTANQSSMSTTVGKTLAFAALRVADGQVDSRGVQGPYDRDVWEGVLSSLEEAGVVVEEQWN